MNRRSLLTVLGGLAALSAARGEIAGAVDRPTSVVVPFAPGGASDLVVRLLCEALSAEFGRPFIAEHKPGAGGLIAVGELAQRPADGRTLLYGNQGQIVVAPHLFPAAGADPRASLVPVAQTVRTRFLLVVPIASPHPTARALLASARPETPLRFGTPGIGTPPHLALALLAGATGVPIEPVPYQGSAPMQVDLIAGRLDAAFDNLASSLPQMGGGRLRALAVSSRQRAAAAPDVPALDEAGVPGYDYSAWQGLFAPRDTAASMVEALASAVQRALAETERRRRLEAAGLEPAVEGPQAFAALIARDAEAWDARWLRGVLRGS